MFPTELLRSPWWWLQVLKCFVSFSSSFLQHSVSQWDAQKTFRRLRWAEVCGATIRQGPSKWPGSTKGLRAVWELAEVTRGGVEFGSCTGVHFFRILACLLPLCWMCKPGGGRKWFQVKRPLASKYPLYYRCWWLRYLWLCHRVFHNKSCVGFLPTGITCACQWSRLRKWWTPSICNTHQRLYSTTLRTTHGFSVPENALGVLRSNIFFNLWVLFTFGGWKSF